MPSDPRFAQSQLVLPDPTDINALAIQQQFRNLQPWGLRVHQTTIQSLVSGGFSPVSFNSQDYNTYQSLVASKYSLTWTANGAYPYNILTVPQTGRYDIRALVEVTGNSAATTQNVAAIFINGSFYSLGSDQFFTTVATDPVACEVNDVIKLDAGNTIVIQIYISGVSVWATSGRPYTRMSIGYLGPS